MKWHRPGSTPDKKKRRLIEESKYSKKYSSEMGLHTWVNNRQFLNQQENNSVCSLNLDSGFC